jgi:hypothetical protein
MQVRVEQEKAMNRTRDTKGGLWMVGAGERSGRESEEAKIISHKMGAYGCAAVAAKPEELMYKQERKRDSTCRSCTPAWIT